ncbi:c-type cytochrome [Massilia sp. TWR1-2-2]|uniref:c-type cytochrome n=1 Tax=Massilia sp. TWR1-2-2 TaxID=2804584 RepID=UPI003CE911EC
MLANRTRLMFKTAAATVLLGAVGAGLVGALVLRGGWYNIAATQQHFQVVHTLLEQGMRDSVRHHARKVLAPDLTSAQQVRRGAVLYRDNCAHCHGGPGFAQSDWGKSMQPLPGPLVDASRHWNAGELYWITKNGIKMSGMPAWEYHMADAELWAVVAFLQQLPALTPKSYADITAGEVAR